MWQAFLALRFRVWGTQLGGSHLFEEDRTMDGGNLAPLPQDTLSSTGYVG